MAIAAMTAQERAALVEWQRSDRTYESVQRFLRTGRGSQRVEQLADVLTSAVNRGRLARDVTLWRGMRSSLRTFGIASTRLAELVGVTKPMLGLFAASASRHVAIGHFTLPALAGGPALMEAHVSAGTHAAWVSGAGDPRLRHQAELLLGDRKLVKVMGAEYIGDLAVLAVEVL